MAENNYNSFSFFANNQEQLTVAEDDGGQLDIATAIASGRWAIDGDWLVLTAASAGKTMVWEAASSKEARKGGQKKILCYAL